jgi:hypothetical protein
MVDKHGRPKRKADAKQITAPPPPPNYDKSTPKFCLRHLHSDHDVGCLDQEHRAGFAMSLQSRARMTWQEIRQASRHGLGTERIPRAQIHPPIPDDFQDQESFTVLRYHGLLPMVGTRSKDVFHILWIEAKFGDVYDHGD